MRRRTSWPVAVVPASLQFNGRSTDSMAVSATSSTQPGTLPPRAGEECRPGLTRPPVPECSGAVVRSKSKPCEAVSTAELRRNYGGCTGGSSGCPDQASVGRWPVLVTQYSPPFWAGVAKGFKGNGSGDLRPGNRCPKRDSSQLLASVHRRPAGTALPRLRPRVETRPALV
jgi:hypothetical protein